MAKRVDSIWRSARRSVSEDGFEEKRKELDFETHQPRFGLANAFVFWGSGRYRSSVISRKSDRRYGAITAKDRRNRTRWVCRVDKPSVGLFSVVGGISALQLPSCLRLHLIVNAVDRPSPSWSTLGISKLAMACCLVS